jgi:hypothetical protein
MRKVIGTLNFEKSQCGILPCGPLYRTCWLWSDFAPEAEGASLTNNSEMIGGRDH